MTIFSRRIFLTGAAVAVAGTSATRLANAQDACTLMSKGVREGLTPDAVIQALKDGNARFVAGRTERCDLMAQVKGTAGGQAPMAAVVGCIDSRVPPELVFDQHIGDIFAARIAGNFINTDILGSLEFATKAAGAKAIVVLGHTSCGAIKGAIDQVKLGNLTAMLANLEPAVAAVGNQGERSSKNGPLTDAVTLANVKLAVAALTERSEVLQDLVANKEIVVAGAIHDIATGEVRFT